MIKYHETNHPKWKWELDEDYVIEVLYLIGVFIRGNTEYIEVHIDYPPRKCYLLLKKGYAINGVNLLPDLDCWMRGAFVHDALWQLIELGKLPVSMVGVSNRIFRDIIAEDDNKVNAWLMYIGVQIGGLWRFKLKPKKLWSDLF